MKKVLTSSLTLLLTLAFVLPMSACKGQSLPMTQEVHDRGQNIVQVTEQYLAGGISAEQARDSVTAECVAMSNVVDYSLEGDATVMAYANLINTELNLVCSGSDNMDSMLRDDTQSLKDLL